MWRQHRLALSIVPLLRKGSSGPSTTPGSIQGGRPVRFSAQSTADQVVLAAAVSQEAENVGFSPWAGASLSV